MKPDAQPSRDPLDVSVLLVNWNSKAYLRECLTSLFRHCRSRRLEVIVVDGASFDGCGEMLAREFPAVQFIQSQENIGFARANNLAAASARGRALFLLNPDTVLSEDSIGIMLDCLDRLPDAGAVGCRLLNSDGSLQTSCVQSLPTPLNQALDAEVLRRLFPRAGLWGIAALYATPPREAEVEALSGAAILIRRELFARVGGFSTAYFMYGEDMDLCYKVHRTGARVYYTPHTNIVHHGGGSSQTAPSHFSVVMMRESVRLFLILNRTRLHAASYRLLMGLSALVRLGLLLLSLPIQILRHRATSVRGAMAKWRAVLQWSISRQSALKPHLPPPREITS